MVTAGVIRDSEVANCSLYCFSSLTEIFVLVVHFTALLKSNIIGLICEIYTFISPGVGIRNREFFSILENAISNIQIVFQVLKRKKFNKAIKVPVKKQAMEVDKPNLNLNIIS